MPWNGCGFTVLNIFIDRMATRLREETNNRCFKDAAKDLFVSSHAAFKISDSLIALSVEYLPHHDSIQAKVRLHS
jgi:hypothetical protein